MLPALIKKCLRRTSTLFFLLLSSQVYAQSLLEELNSVPDNSWLPASKNAFSDVWTPQDQRPSPEAGDILGSPKAIIGAWGSMAWDSRRENLIFWGGGHANYPGNEVYLWNSASRKWQRGSLPSEVEKVNSYGLYLAVDGLDNAPTSSHTYDNSEYLPIVDRFVTFGGATYNTGRFLENAARDYKAGPYFWNPALASPNKVGGADNSHAKPDIFPNVVGGAMWQNRDNLITGMTASGDFPGGSFNGFINGGTAYTQEDGRDVLYISDGDLWKYTVESSGNNASDRFEKIGTGTIGEQGPAAYDPERQLFVKIRGSSFVVWDVSRASESNAGIGFVPSDLSGRFNFADLLNYGMDFDPIRQRFILWGGYGDVWQLLPPADSNLSSGWQLSSLSVSGELLPNRGSGGFTGVLGKWKYIPSYDVFIGVLNGVDGDIWVYKPTQWQPQKNLNSDNQAPVVTLINVSNNEIVTGSKTVTISAADNQSIDNVALYADGQLIGTASISPYQIEFDSTTLRNGFTSLHAEATDLQGNRGESPYLRVNIANIIPEDTSPPQIRILSPLMSESVSGVYIIHLAVKDDVGIDRQSVSVNGDVICTDMLEGETCQWDTSQHSAGEYIVAASVWDYFGNKTETSTVVNVVGSAGNYAPAITLTSPEHQVGYGAGEVLTISAEVEDVDSDSVMVDFYAGVTRLATVTQAPYQYHWQPGTEGIYHIRAIARDSDGNSTGSNVAIVSSGIATVTMQEGMLGYVGMQDAYIDAYFQGSNTSQRTELKDQESSIYKNRMLLRFPIFRSEGGWIPDGATVESATLSMYKATYYDQKYQVNLLLKQWKDDEVNWNQAREGVPWMEPGAEAEYFDIEHIVTGYGEAGWFGGWVDFNVTDAVHAIAQGMPNYGWRIKGISGNYNLKKYYSSEYTGVITSRPKLIVSYSYAGDSNQPPNVSLSSPTDNSQYNEGEDISLVAQASDGDGEIVDVSFYAGNVLLASVSNPPYEFTWSGASPGNYLMTAVAQDNEGGSRTSAGINVIVNGPAVNQPPIVSVLTPASGENVDTGDTLLISVSASDSDGEIASVRFYLDGELLGESVTAPYEWQWPAEGVGQHSIYAQATDNEGSVTVSDSVSFEVIQPNLVPEVFWLAPSDASQFVQGETIQLQVDAYDSDGSIDRVEYYAGTELIGSVSAAPYDLSWLPSTIGVYQIHAEAFDNQGAKGTSDVISIGVGASVPDNQVTLQDGLSGYSGTRDSYLDRYFSGANRGAKEELIGRESSLYTNRMLVRFAIYQSEGGPVPDGAHIESAVLMVYKATAYDHIYAARRLLLDWDEANVDWNEAAIGVPWSAGGASAEGMDVGIDVSEQGSIGWSAGWLEIDVTVSVQAMSGGAANYGWLLDSQGGNRNLKRFRSREYAADPSLRPKLVIGYSMSE